jgi:hypothetical protein
MEVSRSQEKPNGQKPNAAVEKSGKPSVLAKITETFRRAWAGIDASLPYVSRKAVSPKERESAGVPLDSQNHAFYLGKLIRQSTRAKIRGVLTASQERLYDDDFLKGALEYLVENLAEGQKAQITIGPQVGEIFNDPNPAAMSAEEEKAHILEMAKKMGPKISERIEVKSLDDFPEHKELLDALRVQKNSENNEVYLDKALRTDEPVDFTSGPEPRVTPLKIAQCLYMGATEDQVFMNKIAKGIPGKLKEEDGEESPKYGYSLTEIAIRLYEIINGRYIHGGASRQAVYDYVIMGLINQPDKHKAPSLQPLIQLLKGKKFETMHLDTDKNPHRQKSRKKRARRQILAATILGAAVAAAPGVAENRYEAYKESQAREMISAVVKERIRGMRMGFEHFSMDMTEDVIKGRLESAIEEMEIRFGISKEQQGELNLPALLMQFMLENSNLVEWPGSENKSNEALVLDLFIRQNAILLRSRGVNIERPYDNLWKYKDLLLQAAEGQVPEISKDTESRHISCERPIPGDDCELPKKIGVLRAHDSSSYGWDHDYVLFTINKDGKKILIARDWVENRQESIFYYLGFGKKIESFQEEDLLTKWSYYKSAREYESKGMVATTEMARKAAQEWVTEMKRWDASALYSVEHRIYNLNYVDDEKVNYEDNPPYILLEERSHQDQNWISSHTGITEKTYTYTDSFGAFSYEIMETFCMAFYDNMENITHSVDCIYARRPGEKQFSLLTAIDVAEQYYRAENNLYWWNPDSIMRDSSFMKRYGH